MKKQAVLVRIPGLDAYSNEFKEKISLQIRDTLQQQFEKEVVVLVYNDDLHFLDEGEVRDLIDTLENVIK